ncbi:MAG: UdgX family uracil-DNA binding protein [Rhodospirillales bacterium]|nr:UdgX family uracil-DNA binding protein [Rhodospirillales bacterium]
MIEVTLAGEADFEAWRAEARRLLADAQPPEAVLWRVEAATDLFASPAEDPASDEAPAASAAASPAVPRRFVEAARSAICHRDPERFALLYAMLWRIARGGERHLLDAAADPEVRRLAAMTQAVRRDIHKMKAFVRFREVAGEAGEPVYVAWFEPEHHILAQTAPFFAERFASMRWSILTPEASARWDLQRLSFGAGASKRDVPSEDALEEYWRTYYASIFNPARLNTAAMKAQMPVKYWKNLPEASLIAPLAAAAGQRAEAMIAAPPAPAPLRAARIASGARAAGSPTAEESMALPDLARLKEEAGGCRRCPLWEPATQTVFGEGPADAALMLVGEQPGDKEDLAGRPFVGPAGAVLDRALAEAGIDRAGVYVSNAVKHFKFLIRGTRRLHQKPSVFEIDTCRYWLDAEIEAVAPRLVVAMGATAGRGVFARDVKIGRERGRVIDLRQGQRALLTVHPSYLLRLPDQEAKDREYARFVDDLRLAREALAA